MDCDIFAIVYLVVNFLWAVIPAQAGIQKQSTKNLDTSFRWHDNRRLTSQWLFLFFIFSYVLWQFYFSIMRYITALDFGFKP